MAKRGRRNTRPMPLQTIERTVLILRGRGVMLDSDLALVYGVTTKVLNQAVKRNVKRFPSDFRFQLTTAERDEVVTNCDHLRSLKFSPVRPWAFTEHGAIMAASVLKSSRAIEMSVFVVRAFIRLRDLTRTRADLVEKVDAIERRVAGHDEDIEQMFAALRTLIEPAQTAPADWLSNASSSLGVVGDGLQAVPPRRRHALKGVPYKPVRRQ